jgi:hypothetical protein
MTPHVLVADSTNHASTGEIAEVIAGELTTAVHA